MIGYKLMEMRKDGTLRALFIGRDRVYRIGETYERECLPTVGYALRPGFHTCKYPIAEHLSLKPKNKPQRYWVKVEFDDYTTYSRPLLQGGEWCLAKKIKFLGIASDEEVEKMYDEGLTKLICNELSEAGKIGLRCCQLPKVYKERVSRLFGDSYYFTTDKKGKLWLNWE